MSFQQKKNALNYGPNHIINDSLSVIAVSDYGLRSERLNHVHVPLMTHKDERSVLLQPKIIVLQVQKLLFGRLAAYILIR